MSGIAGAFRLRRQARRDSAGLVRRMLAVMAHRGPDQTLLHRSSGDRMVLGECRQGDGQGDVAANEAGTIHAVFDGQIYNGLALRHGLSFDGHVLRGGTDAELAVHGFEQHGLEYLSQISGRFALALWDDRFDRLMLARDRMGKKPLYFVRHDELLLFASEIKALTAAVPFHRQIDPVAMQQFLTWGFVAPPLTMFQGVGKLAAGESLVIEPGGTMRRMAWWRPCGDSRKAARIRALSGDDHRRNLQRLLDASVADRLGTDARLACLVDAGGTGQTVATLAARMVGRPIEAICVHAMEPGRLPPRRGALPLYPVGLRADEVAAALPDLVRHLDEPVADLTAPFLWRGAQVLRAHGITAALTGDGAEVLIPGRQPSSFPSAGLLARLARCWRRSPPAAAAAGPFTAAELARLLGPAVVPQAILSQDFASSDMIAPPPPWLTHDEAIRAAVAVRGLLPEARLMRADKMAMAHGVNLRAPFLDHQLVDYVLALRGFPTGDRLLLDLFGDGDSDAETRGVMGRWLAGPLGACCEEAIQRSRLFRDGLLDARGCLELLRRHRQDGRQGARLWAVLMLAEWYDLFWVANGESGTAPTLPWPGQSAAAE